MLIKDEGMQSRHAEALAMESYEAQLRGWLADKLQHEKFFTNDLSPTNHARQQGRQLTSDKFEELLRPYLPSSMKCLPHPSNLTKRWIGQEVAGALTTVVVYESGLMPEHSLMEEFTEDVWDGTSHIDRKDLPTKEGELGPGVRTAVTAAREVQRGWRTVIIRLVEEGVLTPTQAEALFGAANRTEWAHAMGKAPRKDVPW